MIFEAAAVLGLLAGFLAGGRFRRLLSFRLRGLWLLLGSVVLNLLPRIPALAGGLSSLGTPGALSFAIVRYGLLFGFVALNLRNIPVDLIGFGGLLNFLVILANAGKMPVLAAIVSAAPGSASLKLLRGGAVLSYTVSDSRSRLLFLCDRFRLGGFVYSVGDFIIAAGVAALLFFLMEPKRLPVKIRGA